MQGTCHEELEFEANGGGEFGFLFAYPVPRTSCFTPWVVDRMQVVWSPV
jgi:hypothetical protein